MIINILIGVFYVALIALISYLLYYIIKMAIKDAYFELEDNDEKYEKTYDNTELNNKEE